MIEWKVYIDYMDCNNSFKATRKYFKTYNDAMSFMVETFDKVNSDLINFI